MPELPSVPFFKSSATSVRSKKKRKRKEEKVALVFNGSDQEEKRARPSKNALLLQDLTLGGYLLNRIKEREISEQLDREGASLSLNEPEELERLEDLREALRTDDLPQRRIKYHPDLLEEAARTERLERLPEPDGDDDENFDLTAEDRARLEAMFSELEGGGKELEASAEAEEQEDEQEKSCEEEESDVERATGSDDEDDDYEPGDEEAEAFNGKPKGHFSRWEKDPSRPSHNTGKKQKKFKPRMNVVWQQRLENSKLEKQKKGEPEFDPHAPPAHGSLFNSIIPRKYRRKTRSKLPSIVVSNAKKLEPPTPANINKPRTNRSSELRLQKRLLKEAAAAGRQPRRRKQDADKKRVRRSQSHSSVKKDVSGLVRRPSSLARRSSSLRAFPVDEDRRLSLASQAGDQTDNDDNTDNKDNEETPRPTRKGTPHPNKRLDSSRPSVSNQSSDIGEDDIAVTPVPRRLYTPTC